MRDGYHEQVCYVVLILRNMSLFYSVLISKVIGWWEDPLHRAKALYYFAPLPACTIGVETCEGAHYWARELGKQGHKTRLINGVFVMPYRRKNKNDANDAEAVDRPDMCFVAVKSEGQQSTLMAHRRREPSIATRTLLINQLHGHLHGLLMVIRKSRTFARTFMR